MPAVDGSLLTGVNAAKIATRTVAATPPGAGQVLGWNVTSNQWEPSAGNANAVTYLQTANGLIGGPVTATGTIAVDAGTGANKILQLNASAQIPAVDGSQLTAINAVALQTRAVAATPPMAGQVLGWNVTTTQWEPFFAAQGSVVNIASGAGLLGGPISSSGTLSVDVGSSAFKIVQENANAQIAQLSGTVGQPAYTFVGNASTGIYSPGPGALSLSSNGTAALSVVASGAVGIGSTAPTAGYVLDANGNVRANGNVFAVGNLTGAQLYAPFVKGSPSAANQTLIIDSTDNVAKGNILIAPGGGNVGIGTAAPAAALDVYATGTGSSAIVVPRDTLANRPSAPVNGMIRYASDTGKLEAYQGGVWLNMLGGTASSLPLNGITAATAVNTIDSLNFAQAWNWSTATTQTPLSVSANALTSGAALSVTSSSNALNSTNGLLNVANLGTSTNGTVARVLANSTAGSGLYVLANGNVGVGTNAPTQALQVTAPSYPKLQVGPSTTANDAAQLILSGTDGSTVANSSFVTGYGNGKLQLTAGSGGYVQSNSRLGVYSSTTPLSIMDVNGNVSIGAYAGVAAPTNGLIVSGAVGLGTSVPLAALDVTATGTAASAIIVPRDLSTSRPSAPVNGMIRYATDTAKLETYQNGSWQNVLGGSASSMPLNGITAAAGP